MPNSLPAALFRIDRDAGVPIGTQLAWRLRRVIDEGRLSPGDRLPSVRRFADEAGVNVNTVRAVYARLESQGYLRSEQGRGTFVSAPARASDRDSNVPERRELQRQISELEERLVRHPPPRSEAQPVRRPATRQAASLLTTEQLRRVRDDLLDRLERLEVARAEILQELRALDAVDEASPARERPARQSASLAGARVRFVGGA